MVHIKGRNEPDVMCVVACDILCIDFDIFNEIECVLTQRATLDL